MKKGRKKSSRSVKIPHQGSGRRGVLTEQEISEATVGLHPQPKDLNFMQVVPGSERFFTDTAPTAVLVQELLRRDRQELVALLGEDLLGGVPKVSAYYTFGEEQGDQCIAINIEPAAITELSFAGKPVYEDLDPDLQSYTGRLACLNLPVVLARLLQKAMEKVLSDLPKNAFEGIPANFRARLSNRGPDRSVDRED